VTNPGKEKRKKRQEICTSVREVRVEEERPRRLSLLWGKQTEGEREALNKSRTKLGKNLGLFVPTERRGVVHPKRIRIDDIRGVIKKVQSVSCLGDFQCRPKS